MPNRTDFNNQKILSCGKSYFVFRSWEALFKAKVTSIILERLIKDRLIH